MPLRDDILAAFIKGIRIDSVYYRCKSADRLSSRRLRIVLVEGKNREIRKVLDHFGIRIKSLIRTRIGPVSLGQLKYGEFRDLLPAEIADLLAEAKNKDEDSSEI